MSERRKQLGAWGEERARRYLEELGYRFVAKNFRWRLGEIDLLMRDGELLICVEVKVRSRNAIPVSLQVSRMQQERLVRTAQYYVQQQQLGSRLVRFDVVLIDLSQGQVYIAHIRDAFRASGW